MNIDAHFHLWSPARGDYGWMDAPAAAPIRRDVAPRDYEAHRVDWNIDKAVIVQAAPTTNETDYMLGLADATDWIAKVVGWVDFENPADRRRLEAWVRHPKFAGVRPMIQDIADPDWMHRPDIVWAYRAVEELDLTFDALGYPLHLDNFRRLFDRQKSMRVVIDHCMKPVIRAGRFDDWAARMELIARETPVHCKLSGLATEAAPGWTAETLKPYVDHVLACFGAGRVMWGSDWPVLDLNGSYAGWREASLALVPAAAAPEVFGATAARFYRIS